MGGELELLATQPKTPQTEALEWVGVLTYGLVLVFASKMAHFLMHPDMVLGTPMCAWWVGPILALGVTKNFFECFWQCTPCMLKRPKMQLKKMGWGEFFEDFFKTVSPI